jgi:hypothetical protein
MDDTEAMWVIEDWDGLVKMVGEATDNEWGILSDWLHSGMAAVLVNGLPRVIYGTIH